MTFRRISVEQALFALAFALGLALRLIHLGRAYLSESEATLALQALELVRGSRPLLGASSGYTLLTSVFFFIFGSNEFAARLGPALAGSLLVLVPYGLRERLGQVPAVLLALALAIDPGLIAVSRQADGLMLAVSFLLLAVVFLVNRRPAAAGAFAALALLSGPSVWMGLLIVGLALGWTRLASRQSPESGGDVASMEVDTTPFIRPVPWRTILTWGGITLLFFGTMFWIAPKGLNGLASGLVVFLQGWVGQAATWGPLMGIALVVYAPLALVFGGMGIAWGLRNRDEIDLFLSRGLLVALVLVGIYPGRQVADLVWVLVPLWALASRQLGRWVVTLRGDLRSIAAPTILVVVLSFFIGLNYAGVGSSTLATLDLQLRLASIAGAVIFILLLTILVAWGWSVRLAVNGLGCGIGAVLLVYTLALSGHAAGFNPHPEAEMWQKSPYLPQANLLIQTMGDVSEWNTGERKVLDLAVVNLSSDALRWSLRDLRSVQEVNFLPSDARPSMLITSDKEMPQLADAYTGQDFLWTQQPVWPLMTLREWQQWSVFREAPADKQQLILWVRTDLFPGAVVPQGDGS